MLRYCLFLRSAPHHSEANISRCTVSVLPVIYAGATKLHIKPNCVYLNKQSNRRARNEIHPHPDPLPGRERGKRRGGILKCVQDSSLSPMGCTVRGHGRQVFGDMVNTF
ncbi:hypothetical protein DN595_19730 [Enterobacter cloacae]|uniref:Uncharacterized protein n=1 Tax=Enterobacter cloacae TaxID=550 RepID=A0AB37VEG1_ENTCL|nr:hypothetical protein DN595_19730 [Enterobacter cloacae]